MPNISYDALKKKVEEKLRNNPLAEECYLPALKMLPSTISQAMKDLQRTKIKVVDEKTNLEPKQYFFENEEQVVQLIKKLSRQNQEIEHYLSTHLHQGGFLNSARMLITSYFAPEQFSFRYADGCTSTFTLKKNGPLIHEESFDITNIQARETTIEAGCPITVKLKSVISVQDGKIDHEYQDIEIIGSGKDLFSTNFIQALKISEYIQDIQEGGSLQYYSDNNGEGIFHYALKKHLKDPKKHREDLIALFTQPNTDIGKALQAIMDVYSRGSEKDKKAIIFDLTTYKKNSFILKAMQTQLENMRALSQSKKDSFNKQRKSLSEGFFKLSTRKATQLLIPLLQEFNGIYDGTVQETTDIIRNVNVQGNEALRLMYNYALSNITESKIMLTHEKINALKKLQASAQQNKKLDETIVYGAELSTDTPGSYTRRNQQFNMTFFMYMSFNLFHVLNKKEQPDKEKLNQAYALIDSIIRDIQIRNTTVDGKKDARTALLALGEAIYSIIPPKQENDEQFADILKYASKCGVPQAIINNIKKFSFVELCEIHDWALQNTALTKDESKDLLEFLNSANRTKQKSKLLQEQMENFTTKLNSTGSDKNITTILRIIQLTKEYYQLDNHELIYKDFEKEFVDVLQPLILKKISQMDLTTKEKLSNEINGILQTIPAEQIKLLCRQIQTSQQILRTSSMPSSTPGSNVPPTGRPHAVTMGYTYDASSLPLFATVSLVQVNARLEDFQKTLKEKTSTENMVVSDITEDKKSFRVRIRIPSVTFFVVEGEDSSVFLQIPSILLGSDSGKENILKTICEIAVDAAKPGQEFDISKAPSEIQDNLYSFFAQEIKNNNFAAGEEPKVTGYTPPPTTEPIHTAP